MTGYDDQLWKAIRHHGLGANDIPTFAISVAKSAGLTVSISLHQHELSGEERARALVVHDMRHSAIQLVQGEDRFFRERQRATLCCAFAEGTLEEAITATVLRPMASMNAMAGKDTSLLEAIADVVELTVADVDD